ncbi:hypothetical protein CJ230_11275 [Oligella urethralis]|uniref:ABC transporter substrate-binding protein n=1 Tax=Oligella urethralis TaxID=90245 RepID=UPI000C9CB734|nr:iron-siderophore ABC transporter substrate-binding protein [Oligella urethralis]PMC15367.1 hypothetical protein CJ230_11275 [Oligella urethralis]
MNIKRRQLLGLSLASFISYYIYSKPVGFSTPTQQKPRVVTLEYLPTEMLLQLGIIPVGVADIRGYKRWVGYQNELLAQSVSVGTRQQPVLEYIAALKPDLIIGVQFRHLSILSILEIIAPTLLLPDNNTVNGMIELQQNWLAVARHVDLEKMAHQLWEDFEEILKSFKQRLDSPEDEMSILQGLAGSPLFWAFHMNSIPGALVEYMGWKLPIFLNQSSPQGISYISVEQLLSQQGSLTAITDTKTNGVSKLKNLPVWRNIPAIQKGNYRELPLSIWPFGGLIKTLEMADALTLQWELTR